jgi:hypothetical protein
MSQDSVLSIYALGYCYWFPCSRVPIEAYDEIDREVSPFFTFFIFERTTNNTRYRFYNFLDAIGIYWNASGGT